MQPRRTRAGPSRRAACVTLPGSPRIGCWGHAFLQRCPFRPDGEELGLAQNALGSNGAEDGAREGIVSGGRGACLRAFSFATAGQGRARISARVRSPGRPTKDGSGPLGRALQPAGGDPWTFTVPPAPGFDLWGDVVSNTRFPSAGVCTGSGPTGRGQTACLRAMAQKPDGGFVRWQRQEPGNFGLTGKSRTGPCSGPRLRHRGRVLLAGAMGKRVWDARTLREPRAPKKRSCV